jgi:hypothetical protein
MPGIWRSLLSPPRHRISITCHHSCRIPIVLQSVSEAQSMRLFGLVENVSKVATSAVLAVVHGGHEDTSTALGLRALAAETLDLAVAVNLVVLEDSELGLLALVLDLLGGGVHLLLALLGSTFRRRSDAAGPGECPPCLGDVRCYFANRATSGCRTLNLGLDIVDCVRGLHLKAVVVVSEMFMLWSERARVVLLE